MRARIATVLLAVLVVPGSAMAVPEASADAGPDGAPLPPHCLDVDVDLEDENGPVSPGPHHARFPLGCSPAGANTVPIHVSWRKTSESVEGLLRVEMRNLRVPRPSPEDVVKPLNDDEPFHSIQSAQTRIVHVSTLPEALARMLPWARAPATEGSDAADAQANLPPAGSASDLQDLWTSRDGTYVIEIHFHATWRDACSDAKGDSDAQVNGGRADARGFVDVGRACLLQRDLPSAPRPEELFRFADFAVGSVERLAAAQPALGLAPLADSLRRALDVHAPQAEAPAADLVDLEGSARALAVPAQGVLAARAEARSAGLAEGRLVVEAGPREPKLDAPDAQGAHVAPRRQAAPAPRAAGIGVPVAHPAPGAPTRAAPADSSAAGPTEVRLQTYVAGPRATDGATAATAARLAGATAALLAAWALYQRVARAAALRHARRAAIHQALQSQEEGATAGEVARALGMKRKSAEYHLLYMARLGIVQVAVSAAGVRRFSLRAVPPRPTLRDALAALVGAQPGLSTAELARALGASHASVDRAAKDLVLAGKIESRVADGRRRLYASGLTSCTR